MTTGPERMSGQQCEIEEISAGVYRVTGRDASGQRVVVTGTDLLALEAEFRAVDQEPTAGSPVVEFSGLRLGDRWGPRLAGEPETGMGYQIVSILLRDGRRFDDVTIAGGVISNVGDGNAIPFAEHDIVQILVTHGIDALGSSPGGEESVAGCVPPDPTERLQDLE